MFKRNSEAGKVMISELNFLKNLMILIVFAEFL